MMNQIIIQYQRFLSKVEKQTHTNIQKIAKQWSWLVIGKFIGSVSALLLASVYARYLLPEEYGTYKYILAVFSIIGVFTLLGMEDSSQRSIARGLDRAFWDTLKLRIKFGSLTALCSFVIGLYYTLQGDSTLGTIFLAATPFIVALNVVRHYNTILIGRQLFKEISINNTLIQIATAVTIIITVVLTSDLHWLIGAFFFTGIFFSSLGFVHTLKKHKLNNNPDPTAINYGKHMSLLGIVSIATNQAAPLLLWHFLGPSELAIYAFALAAVVQLRGLFKLLTTTMAFPKLSKLKKSVLKTTLPRKILIAHGITIPVACLLALLIPYLYQILFPTYMESVIYAQAMTILLAFSPMRMYSTALMTHGTPKSIHFYSIFTSITSLTSMIILIPIFGIWGVIYATIITQSLCNIVILLLFKRL